jgi:hypothetical protein
MDSSPLGEGKPAVIFLPYIAYLIFLTVLFFLLFQLEPSESGHGTHRQLGFPACGFLTVTGYPCPSCGITTAFVYAARGKWYDALKAQPFGLILFLTLCATGLISIIGILRKIPPSRLMNSREFEILQVGMLILFFLGWVYKIYIMRG